MPTLTATIGEILACRASIPRNDGRRPKSVRTRKPLLQPVKVRVHGRRRGFTDLESHYKETLDIGGTLKVDAVHHALQVLIEVSNTTIEGERIRRLAEKEAEAAAHGDWGQVLLPVTGGVRIADGMNKAHFRPRVLIVESRLDVNYVDDLEVPLPTGITAAHLQFDEFLAPIPSHTPPGKKAGKASWAAPRKGSAPIRNSKPATLPLRQ